jgi:GT2 family glycosyltransferase
MESPHNRNKLSIVIVNWNGENLLPKCLASISRFPPNVPYEVVVVDNYSTDSSVSWLRSDNRRGLIPDDNFKLIESDVNLGFGRANNLAFSQIVSDFIFLLNPDTEVKQGTFDELILRLRDNPELAAVAPRIVDQKGEPRFSVGSDVPSPLKIIIDGFKLSSILPKRILRRWLYSQHWDYSIEEKVPVVSGASFLVRKRVIDEIGGFDEDFHMYGEDLEFSIRILRSFGGILFVPTSVVEHAVGQSSKKRWTEHQQVELQELEHLRFQRKTCGGTRVIFNALAKTVVLIALYLSNLRSVDLRRHFALRIRFQVFQILSPARLESFVAKYLG